MKYSHKIIPAVMLCLTAAANAGDTLLKAPQVTTAANETNNLSQAPSLELPEAMKIYVKKHMVGKMARKWSASCTKGDAGNFSAQAFNAEGLWNPEDINKIWQCVSDRTGNENFKNDHPNFIKALAESSFCTPSNSALKKLNRDATYSVTEKDKRVYTDLQAMINDIETYYNDDEEFSALQQRTSDLEKNFRENKADDQWMRQYRRSCMLVKLVQYFKQEENKGQFEALQDSRQRLDKAIKELNAPLDTKTHFVRNAICKTLKNLADEGWTGDSTSTRQYNYSTEGVSAPYPIPESDLHRVLRHPEAQSARKKISDACKRGKISLYPSGAPAESICYEASIQKPYREGDRWSYVYHFLLTEPDKIKLQLRPVFQKIAQEVKAHITELKKLN